jgi:hypothetical protein
MMINDSGVVQNYSQVLGNETSITPATNGTEEFVGFGYYSLFISLLFLAPTFIIYCLLLLSVITAKSIPGPIRLILANIFVACLLLILGLLGIFMITVTLSGLQYLPQSEPMCRVVVITIVTAGNARLICMATFATVLHITVRCGLSKLRMMPTAIATSILWLLVILPNLALFSPVFLGVTFLEKTDCVPHGVGTGSYTHIFISVAVYGIGSLSLSTILAISSICYIRQHTITQDVRLPRAMIKFSLFLILGNILNFIGISVPTSAIAFYPLFPLENLTKILRILTYIEGVFILVSLIPTPVFTLIFFRTVRYRFKYIISCSCLRVVKERKEARNHMYKAEHDKATTTMNFSNPTAKSPD